MVIQNRYNKNTQYFVNVNMYLTLELVEFELSIHKFKTKNEVEACI